MKIVSLQIGRAGSQGLPGKNWRVVLGRPLCEYAMIAAHNSGVDMHHYVYTDSPEIGELAQNVYGMEWLRTEETGKEVLTEDALINAFKLIALDTVPDYVVLLYSNSPIIQPGWIDKMIIHAINNPELDSVVTVVKYEMFEPLRAMEFQGEHIIVPNWYNCDSCHDTYLEQGNSLRGSGGGIWYNDFAIQVLSKKCFNSMWTGRLPFKWQGLDIAGYQNISGSMDLDAEWQIPVLEWSLKQIGFSSYETPYDEKRTESRWYNWID